MNATERPGGQLGPVAVIIPTYNERDNIELIVSRVRNSAPDADILVVDDNSPDGTGEIADKLAMADQRIHVMHRQGKAGLGVAYRAKPIVAAAARARVDHADLRALLFAQGYRAEEIVAPWP